MKEAEKLLVIENEMKKFREILSTASDTIIAKDVTNYPIFVIHKQDGSSNGLCLSLVVRRWVWFTTHDFEFLVSFLLENSYLYALLYSVQVYFVSCLTPSQKQPVHFTNITAQFTSRLFYFCAT